MEVDPLVQFALRSGFVALFSVAVVHKLRAPTSFMETVRGYLTGFSTPGSWLIKLVAAGVVVVEILVIVALSGSVEPVVQGIITAGLLVLYGVFIALNVAKGNRLQDCGCSFGTVRQGISYRLVIRNAVLAALAAVLAVPVGKREVSPTEIVALLLLMLFMVLIFQVVSQLAANSNSLPRKQ